MQIRQQQISFLQRDSAAGYALPSVLMLIVILSLVVGSVISMQFIRRQLAIAEVSRTASDLAAQNAITETLAQRQTSSELSSLSSSPEVQMSYEDGSRAIINAQPWGLLQLVRSVGISRKYQSKRVALVADHPSATFSNALLFGNPSHQVVFAGESSIKGNITVGQPGVTTGTLRNVRTPSRVPVTGTINRERSPNLPVLEAGGALSQRASLNMLLHDALPSPRCIVIESNEPIRLNGNDIPDSIESVVVRGSASIESKVIRRETPLSIAVSGAVLFRSGTELKGLVAIYSRRILSVPQHAVVEHAILISDTLIHLQGRSSVSGQFFAPQIQLDSLATARYPSLLVSLSFGRPNETQSITIRNGATVEGFVGLISPSSAQHQGNIIVIEPRATVVGATYSDNRTTLDGKVIGTVMTKDFYFYEAPTQYMGWIRNGVIDRTTLSKSYLLPIGFSPNLKLDVLDWL